MNCQFWLLDLDEAKWNDKWCVRLWGIDEDGRRVVIVTTDVPPYFHFLPAGHPDPVLQRLVLETRRFPDISSVTIEQRKRLGTVRAVLRVTCSQQKSVSHYAKQLPKVLGGTSFDDLRQSTRYVTDRALTTCGWNECEVEPFGYDGVRVDEACVATSPPKAIGSTLAPSLRMMGFSLLTVGEEASASPERNPIRAIAVATGSGEHSILRASGEDDSEVSASFIAAVREYDPDVILGYGSNEQLLHYLMRRSRVNKEPLSLGRDGSEPHTSVFGHVSIAGRANLDLADLARGIGEVKVKNVKNIASHFNLPIAERLSERSELESLGLWADVAGREKLVEETTLEAEACLEVGKETIDFPCQLSAITGLPLDHVMTAPAGFRVDSYLIRVAHEVGELVPAKNEESYLTYQGALVQEPKRGIHENVAVLDFASMYPRLMIQYNLSPDTLLHTDNEASPGSINLIPEVEHRFRKTPPGFYTIALARLLDERTRIKQELAIVDVDSTLAKVLRERERAVKMIANACYGYAGWVGARWYVREVAESAAALGRQLITETIEKAMQLGLQVIYSDTDSLFVSNNRPKVNELICWVDEQKKLEIRVEEEYDRVLFTEAMKRYAGLRKDGSLDIVGLEVVRGDWSEIARKVQESVLLAILKDKSIERAIQQVREMVLKLRNGRVAIQDLILRKALTKPIEDYRVRTPHVEVARRLADQGWAIEVGEKVAYVIVNGKGPLFKKARPYNQVRPEELDVEYYIQNQVKPAALRILETFGVSESQVGF